MSSEGLEASEQEIDEVLNDVDEHNEGALADS